MQQIVMDWHSWHVFRVNKFFPQQLRQLYQEAILCCVKHRVHRWWLLLPNDKFDDITVLHAFLREVVLRRAGDYKEFLRIRHELKKIFNHLPGHENFYDQLMQHYDEAISDIDAGRLTQGLIPASEKRRFLIAFSVWGKHYLDIFFVYCLPSIMTEGNLGILCKERQPVFFIHTNPEGKDLIERHELIKKIKAMGILIIYRMISEPLLKHFADDPGHKYWHMGMVQSLDLYLAKVLDADCHPLIPDIVYSNNHFLGLLRAALRGHKVITGLGFGTVMEGICPEIEPYRHAGIISIPAADLMALSIKHLHPAWQSWIMTNKDLATELSIMHIVVWEGKETLHILAPHQNILYLDQQIIRGIPTRYFMTLDSEIDKIIPRDCAVYCPKPEDDIFLAEISAAEQRTPENRRITLDEFAKMFWNNTQESMAYWRVFEEDIVYPLNRSILPEQDFMEEVDILNTKQALKKAVLDRYPRCSAQQIRVGLKILHAVASHPAAKGLAAVLDEAASQVTNSANQENP